ncbi:MAG TPA: aminotransferase class III-fold pyridoxal phosphate-dependent enzyme, partial [Sedimenticola thiotaurini]|nr:aminotransferase class III-fold pyridoxal phosphate-dependent enzyme [Sedimenticola thiotaurini]
RELARVMADSTAHLADHPHVAEVRQHGMILAIEMIRDKASRQPYPWQERRGLRVYRHALEQGALLRPLGNVIYFMPPYVITPDEIRRLAQIATSGIELATRD